MDEEYMVDSIEVYKHLLYTKEIEERLLIKNENKFEFIMLNSINQLKIIKIKLENEKDGIKVIELTLQKKQIEDIVSEILCKNMRFNKFFIDMDLKIEKIRLEKIKGLCFQEEEYDKYYDENKTE